MYHHSSGDYKTSASEAAKTATKQFNDLIELGKRTGTQVIEQVQNTIIQDRIAPANKLEFFASERATVEAEDLLQEILENSKVKATLRGETPDDGLLNLIVKDHETKLHKHALLQAVSKVGFPNAQAFINFCYSLKAEGRTMLADNLTRLIKLENFQDKRFLIRDVGSETRGVLSDRYRRIDSRPLLDAFCGACQDIGALPVKGYAMDTKVLIRAILPYIFEPIDNEVMVFGVEWSNSDFGDGGHSIKLFCIRLWCSNTATIDEVLRQVHIGKRLSDDINYSQETVNADNKANALAVRDVVRDILSPEKVDNMMLSIKKAFETEITPGKAVDELKKYLTSTEVKSAMSVFESNDVYNLPPGQNVYRLSNAVSWIAGGTKDNVRQIELQQFAGKIMPFDKIKAIEV